MTCLFILVTSSGPVTHQRVLKTAYDGDDEVTEMMPTYLIVLDILQA